jgi:pimeloyl-ACP methyl ester carboxylesterase
MPPRPAPVGAVRGLELDELVPGGEPRGVVVLVHGGGLTGRCYLETADGRPGWARNLVGAGFRVVVTHWLAGHGAAPGVATGEQVSRALACLVEAMPVPPVVLVHSMSGPYGFRLAELCGNLLRGMVAVAPGPPGNIQPRPKIISESAEAVTVAQPATEMTLPKAGVWVPSAEFVHKKFVGASRRFPRGHADAYYRTTVPVPASLMLERVNLSSSQLTVEDPARFRGLPVLLATGSGDADHSRAADGATADWLSSLGAAVTYRFLEEGILGGNGHCPMAETNSED